MSNGTTQHTPADMRERVAREVFVCNADWRREYWDQFRRDFPRQAQSYYDTADRILGLFRTPSGEGEDTIPISALRSEIAQLKARGLLPYLAWARLCALAGGGPVGEDTPAALRSDAQEGEADALELIRWAEARGVALEPVAGNVMPPGTYACYVEGVGDDPAEYEDAGEPYMGPGILGAIRAARRGEGGGDGE